MWTIRRCTEADFDSVPALLKELWPDRRLDSAAIHAVYSLALASEMQAYLCAAGEGEVSGFCSLHFKNNLWQAGYIAHVDELVVTERHRRKGIGRILLAAAVDLAFARNCERIELDSAFHRESAHRFYESSGFENRAYLFSKSLRNELSSDPAEVRMGEETSA